MQVLIQRYEDALRRGSVPSSLPRAIRSPRRLEPRASSVNTTRMSFDDQENRGVGRAQSVSRAPMQKRTVITGSRPVGLPPLPAAAIRPRRMSSGTAAGAVTEEEFRSQFSQVPRVSITSAKDVRDQLENVRTVCENTSIDWSKRANSLKLIRSVVINGGLNHESELISALVSLEEALSISVKDLRSQVCKEACVTLCFMAEHSEIGSRLGRLWETALADCITLLPNSAKVMSTSGTMACTFVIKNIDQPKLIPIVLGSVTNRSKEIRRETFAFIAEILKTWNPAKLEKNIQGLVEAIRAGISDADAGARQNGRLAYTALDQQYPERAQALFRTLDAAKQKQLNGSGSAASSTQSIGSLRDQTPLARRPGAMASSVYGRPGAFLSGRSASAIDTNSARKAATPPTRPVYGRVAQSPGIRPNVVRTTPKTAMPLRQSSTNNSASLSQPGSRSTSPTRGSGRLPPVDNRRTPTSVDYSSPVSRGFRHQSNGGINGADAGELFSAIHKLNFTQDDEEDLCSTSSPRSRIDAELTQALAQCASTNPNISTKKEALKKIKDSCCRQLNSSDTHRIFDALMRMLADLNHKIVQSLMETLAELIKYHHKQLEGYLSMLLYKMFARIGQEMLPTVQNHLKTGLSAVRDGFDSKMILYAICKNIQDPVMTQTTKTRQCTLVFLEDLIKSMDEGVDLTKPEVRGAVTKLFTWREEAKLKPIHENCENVFVALFNLNSPDFSELINGLAPTWREFAHGLLSANKGFVAKQNDSLPFSTPASPFRGVDQADGRPMAYASPSLGPVPLNDSASSGGHMPKTLNDSTNSNATVTDMPRLDETVHLAHDEREQSRFISKCLNEMAEADRRPDRIEEQRRAICQLIQMIAEGSFTTWNENFKALMVQIFNALKNSNKIIKKEALRLLTKTCLMQGQRFGEYAEVTMVKVLEAVVEEENSDGPDRAWMLSVADECLKVLAQHLPVHLVIRTLNPIISSASDPRLAASLKMLTRLVENVDVDDLQSLLGEVVPGVVKCYEHSLSPVRKNTVFCLVAMVNKLGKQPIEPYLNELDSKGRRLLDVYVQRAQTASTHF